MAGSLQRWVERLLGAINNVSLPAPSALPAAGAIVGIYCGLLAGIFTNAIGLISTLGQRLAGSGRPVSWEQLGRALAQKNWHLELLVLAAIPAALALLISRTLPPGAARELLRKRLRVLALLLIGGLGLYYPLVALGVVNRVLRWRPEMGSSLGALHPLAVWLVPTLGGLAVGYLLRNRPHLHGHGIPDVVRSVARHGEGLGAREGILKILASSLTIGSGGSAGREGPIVYGGGAIAAGVGRTLGFSQRELAVLIAAGGGAGIAASFNAPMAGAIFAAEIILRQFEVKVFSPIILASVAGTLVGRGALGEPSLLRRLPYSMVSGWEVIPYLGLALVCGLLAYAFLWLLHSTEDLFLGRTPLRLSRWLGRLPNAARAGLGGSLVGLMALASAAVWGTGDHQAALAAGGKMTLAAMALACVLKLLGTTVTLGSGGSGGTFFPALVIGAMAGGAFGSVVHQLLPGVTAPAGAYALVGMGGVVAGFTRGPLTSMVMVYELTGNYQIILPLMIVCTVSSALCHFLAERRFGNAASAEELLRSTEVGKVAARLGTLKASESVASAVDQVFAAGETALPTVGEDGRVLGVVQLHELRSLWGKRGEAAPAEIRGVIHPVGALSGQASLEDALRAMDRADLDVLPVQLDGELGLITRAGIRRYLARATEAAHQRGSLPLSPTET